jgi:hypothetical protein
MFLLIALAGASHAQQPSPPRKPLHNFDKLKDGDLVFIASNTPRAGLIKKMTGSEFSHCGIVFLDDHGKPRVYEGAGANNDIHKPIATWQTDESAPDSGPNIHLVYARRLTGGLSTDQIKTVKAAATKLHKTLYDFAFQMGDPNNIQDGTKYIYCSELIYRAFQSIEKLGNPLRFRYYYERADEGDRAQMDKSLNGRDPNGHDIKQLRNPPGPYSLDEFVISPEDVYRSGRLEDVTDET